MFISKIDFKICLKNRRQRLPDNVMCFTQNSFSGFTDFCIRNIKLHNFGRREIKIAEEVMIFGQFSSDCVHFLKPFLKGKILRSSERGVNSILTTILRF